MVMEFIILVLSLCALVLIYVGRMKTVDGGSFLFKVTFLIKMDEYIFECIKFVFKKYKKVYQAVVHTISEIPHAFLNLIHKISHKTTVKSSHWANTIKNKTQNKFK